MQKTKKQKPVAEKLTLFPFQEEGVEFIERKKGRALIADEMGLGKTVQALAWLKLHMSQVPALVVCPATPKINWQRECLKWTGEHATILGKKELGMALKDILKLGKVFIINYDILKNWGSTLIEMKFKTMILDEVHAIKNVSSQRTKLILLIKRHSPTLTNLIGLTGTPIENSPAELFPFLYMARPDVFPSMTAFQHQFCKAEKGFKGKVQYKECINAKKLHRLLTENVMIRRLKKEVLPQLPRKTRSVQILELDNRREYIKAETDFMRWIQEEYNGCPNKMRAAKRAQALVKIGELKRLTARGKIQHAIAWLEDYRASGKKLVVFTVHKSTMLALREYFGEETAVYLDGSTPQKKRQEAIDKFQNDKSVQFFFGQLKAAGVAITLTAADATAFVEIRWTPGEHDQAEDRVCRIGQTADKVWAYYLLTENTIEERIAQIIDRKRVMASEILDGRKPTDRSVYDLLMNTYGGEDLEQEVEIEDE